jgi:hypothetical protein
MRGGREHSDKLTVCLLTTLRYLSPNSEKQIPSVPCIHDALNPVP